jgi:hypothetical protein
MATIICSKNTGKSPLSQAMTRGYGTYSTKENVNNGRNIMPFTGKLTYSLLVFAMLVFPLLEPEHIGEAPSTAGQWSITTHACGQHERHIPLDAVAPCQACTNGTHTTSIVDACEYSEGLVRDGRSSAPEYTVLSVAGNERRLPQKRGPPPA